MAPEDLAEYEGYEVILRFIDGHVVRGRIVHVDYGDHRDFIYDVLEVIEVGPPEFSTANPGVTAAAPLDDLESFDVYLAPNQGTSSARELQRKIGDTLLRHWDPIGVKDDPECSGEYDSYIGPVYRLLASGASDRDIAEHLVRIETESLGYHDTEWRMLIPVARRLRDVYRSFGGGSPA